ncbi:dienelactone hydrolase family protein, partial [Leptospira sp. SA-E8]|uniref:dienelactone hydrolase family protein n=1 Tax=Leptospira sp. SA-E8 TaxID=3422259 RepID=UPI003EC0F376
GRLSELQRRYAALFHGLQMHVLVLDSLSPRGERSICEYPPLRNPVTLKDRRDDVAAALDWLAARPDVDATRLVLLGWSNGAQTVLGALDASDPAVQARRVHPRAAVAFYPGCTYALRKADYRLQSPLIMLLGELDDWTPVKPCKDLHRRLAGQSPLFELESYPDSYHAFDSMNKLHVRGNVGSTRSGTATVGANPAARDASRERMLRFLDAALR